MTGLSVLDAPTISADMARELALSQHVCIRPLLRRVHDRASGAEDVVALPCGSTREAVCPPCAHKARVLRMQQCADGWHRTDEPEHRDDDHDDQADDDEHDQADDDEHDQADDDEHDQADDDEHDQADDDEHDQADDDEHDQADDDEHDQADDDDEADEDSTRRVRSTRRRQDAPDFPRVAAEHRTVGRVFTAPDGREYRPSMFLTLTLPSYGAIRDGVPVDPGSYDYRRAALDALHFARLVDRFWQNLRRSAGYRVQYFAAVEPQRRLAPHLHAALRGAMPRATIRQVVKATYLQLWWPPHHRPVYVRRVPVWDESDYVDADTGEVLPTWQEALDRLAADPDAQPAHVMRFGAQTDIAGIIAPSPDADRAVRYLTKYLTKSISDPVGSAEGQPDPRMVAHVDRLQAELRWLPCSERCANWLRYGI